MGALKKRRKMRGRKTVRAVPWCRTLRSYRVPASSLLEAVVASVVLLAVFAASLETVVRLTTAPSEGMACVDADYRAACVASEIRRGAF